MLTDPTITALAKLYDRSAAQIVLRWHLQVGNVVIPKSINPVRIRENISGLDFEINESDMAKLCALDSAHRLGPDPDGIDTAPKPGFDNREGRWVEGTS